MFIFIKKGDPPQVVGVLHISAIPNIKVIMKSSDPTMKMYQEVRVQLSSVNPSNAKCIPGHLDASPMMEMPMIPPKMKTVIVDQDFTAGSKLIFTKQQVSPYQLLGRPYFDGSSCGVELLQVNMVQQDGLRYINHLLRPFAKSGPIREGDRLYVYTQRPMMRD